MGNWSYEKHRQLRKWLALDLYLGYSFALISGLIVEGMLTVIVSLIAHFFILDVFPFDLMY